MKIKLLYFIIPLILFLSCSDNVNKRQKTDYEQNKPIPQSYIGMIKYYYELQANPKFTEVYIYDTYSFFKKYSTEILATIQLKDSLVTDKIGVALYTYSIGPVTYNGKLWFRNFDGKWRICASQYFSDYSDDPFEDGMPDRAKEIIKKVNNWIKANKGVWWEY